jgi:hypothetical protein
MGHATLPGAVAYICGEGQGGLGIRVKSQVLRQEQDNTKAIAEIARTQGDEAARSFIASLPSYTSDNLKVMTNPFPMHFTGNGKPNADLEQAMGELRRLNCPPDDADVETVEHWPYLRLVILDALENFAGQLSVSHRSSANRIIATMQWMAAELQCCVLAVAHPVNGPGGLKMVGSDRLFAAADFVIRYAPDDVAAPGALNTATISCEKSKDDTKFSSFGVELHPCKWDEPRLDEDWEPIPVLDDETGEQVTDERGNPVWETVVVTSQTVRLIEQDTTSSPKAAPVRPVMAAPELRDNRPASRIRPILRPEPGARPWSAPALAGAMPVPPVAAPVPASTATQKEATPAPATVPAGAKPLATLASNAARLRYFAKQVLAQECEECGRPAQAGCYGKQGTMVLGQSLSGELRAHDSRVLAAALASPDPEEFLAKVLEVLTPVPVVPARPAAVASDRPEPAPAPVADPLAGRLSWTTVRPDSPPPTLEQIFAGA